MLGILPFTDFFIWLILLTISSLSIIEKSGPLVFKIKAGCFYFNNKSINSSCLGKPKETQTISGFLFFKSSIQ